MTKSELIQCLEEAVEFYEQESCRTYAWGKNLCQAMEKLSRTYDDLIKTLTDD
jgi:hypothetical protein